MTFSLVIIVLFPLIVPSTPSLTLAASLVAASMAPLGLGILHWIGAIEEVSLVDFVNVTAGPLGCVALAYLGSRVIYNIGTELVRARELGSRFATLCVKPTARASSWGYGADTDFIKVLDFGLVKRSSQAEVDPHVTQDGRLIGTPAFMAPEMVMSAPDVDSRVDIYSLGCVAELDIPEARAVKIHDVCALWDRSCRGRIGGRLAGPSNERQPDREGRAVADPAGHGDLTAHHLAEAL